MTLIENKTFDNERALYGSCDVTARKCSFDGPADGESAFKESKNITAEDCYFNLRYPFWHDNGLNIKNCEMTSLCRAPLWYSENITITDSKLHGVKALRECGNISVTGCDIISPEFGWFVHDIKMSDSSAEGEYFMMRSDRLSFNNISLKGKYSFQYITDSVFDNCVFDTKDAFWHAKNVTVRNSVINGEYLAWYCENVVFENCKISGTQPLCYCKGLKMINCELTNADLSFEKSDVNADITTHIISIKNPSSGILTCPSAGEIIMDDKTSTAVINCKNTVE